MKNNVILVGGSGLVGRSSVELFLSQNFRVFVLDMHQEKDIINNKVTFIKCDINKKFFFKKIINEIPANSYVVNLAARQYSNKPPRKDRLDWFMQTNYHGAKNVIDFAKNINSKGFIQFSTDMVYGLPKSTPVEENHVFNPIGEYGQSKSKIESYIRKNRNFLSFPITILRPRLILGKGRLGVFKSLFQLIKYNIPIPLIGKGDNYYQMLSDKDCANAILLTINKGCPNTVFNLGSQVNKSVYTLLNNLIIKNKTLSFLVKTSPFLIKFALKLFNTFKIEILYKEQYELADKNFIVDTKKAQNILGWVPEDKDEDMLLAVYKHWLIQNVKEKL